VLNEIGDHSLFICWHMQRKVLRLTDKFQVSDSVVQLILVFVVDTHPARYLTVGFNPHELRAENPLTRFCNFYKRTLLASSLVPRPNDNIAYFVTLVLAVALSRFHSNIIPTTTAVATLRNVKYKPPFPWFGGKSPVASLVWEAIGWDVVNYCEPFFGSGAALFLRPGGPGKIETVNDADGFVANFWRALQHDSDAVAEHADWPVNEADLHARHLWLLGQRERLTDQLCGDPEFYDAKAAGWWVWGQCCWIGSGWCSGRGPWTSVDGVMALRNTGRGVNRQLPHLGNTGRGVNRQLPHLGNTGRGVNRQLPHLGDTGKGDDTATPREDWLREYLGGFAARLRNVRVCCGDWSRVCGPSVTFRHGPTGVFLDPPYADSADRTEGLYATDCEQVAHAVREWAIEQGSNKLMRIVLAGYEGEHVMPDDWRVAEWEATGGYALIADDDDEAVGRANKKRERLWFSPHCKDQKQASLFA
jgi:hypothetical protein